MNLALSSPEEIDEWEGEIHDNEGGILVGKAKLDYQTNSQDVFFLLLLRNDAWHKLDLGWSGYVLILVQDKSSFPEYRRIGLGALGCGKSYLAYFDDCPSETTMTS